MAHSQLRNNSAAIALLQELHASCGCLTAGCAADASATTAPTVAPLTSTALVPSNGAASSSTALVPSNGAAPLSSSSSSTAVGTNASSSRPGQSSCGRPNTSTATSEVAPLSPFSRKHVWARLPTTGDDVPVPPARKGAVIDWSSRAKGVDPAAGRGSTACHTAAAVHYLLNLPGPPVVPRVDARGGVIALEDAAAWAKRVVHTRVAVDAVGVGAAAAAAVAATGKENARGGSGDGGGGGRGG